MTRYPIESRLKGPTNTQLKSRYRGSGVGTAAQDITSTLISAMSKIDIFV